MSDIYRFLSVNMDIVFFAYGMAFALMGASVFIQRKATSRFKMAESFWLLAGFGIIHGINEFLEMWRIVKFGGLQQFHEIDLFFLALSFVFLFEFGRRSLSMGSVPGPWLCSQKKLPYYTAPILLVIIAGISGLSAEPVNTAKILSRYLLCLPGALLAGVGFLCFLRAENKSSIQVKVRTHFLTAGIAFMLYGMVSGLVVNKGGFFPADLLNVESFFMAAGLPVQLFRATCALAIAWGILGSLRIFHRETEIELISLNQEMRDIIEFLPDPTFVLDRNNEVIAWNNALEKLTGTPKREMLGKGNFEYAIPFYGVRRPLLLNYVNAAEKEVTAHYSCAVRNEAKTLSAELFLPKLNNGTGAHVWITAAPLLDPEGVVFGGIESIRDISEKKKLQELQQQLEDKLRQAQKMEAIGQLAGGVAHDFNNLLTAILNHSIFLLRSLPENSAEWADAGEIKKAGERGAALTRQLLAFSRKQVLSPKVLVADEIVASAHTLLSRLIGEDILFSLKLNAGKHKIKVDQEQMGQAIINLVVNARDAMPSGGRLLIETSVEELAGGPDSPAQQIGAGKYLKLSVSDTGQGMSAEIKSKIFEPFYTTKEIGRGTGLGLSSVDGFIKQSGGQIVVASAPGKGSTFTIYLPLAGGSVQEAPGKPSKDAESAVNNSGTEAVLLVEDDESIRNLAKRVLSADGYKVSCAETPLAALLLCEKAENPFQLLITDMVMPHMNGSELAKQVSSMQPGIKVLLMSGYPGDFLALTGPGSRHFAFLNKPFPPDTLLATVREVLDAG